MINKNRRFPIGTAILPRFFAIIALFVVTLLTACSLIRTEVFPLDYLESPRNSPSSAIISAILTLCCFVCGIRIFPQLQKCSLERLYKIQGIAIIFIGAFWLTIATTGAVADQGISLAFANWFLEGNVKSIYENGYLQQYPFQSGYILFCAFIGNLFGKYNLLPLRFFNLLMVFLSIRTLCKLIEILFRRENLTKIAILLSSAFLPFILFETFIYGNMPSIAFCLIACYLQQKVISLNKLNAHTITLCILSICFLFLALWFKPNSLIFLIGIELIWMITLLKTRKFLYAVVILLAALAYVSANAVPVAYMEKETGVEINDNPIPKSAWIAMGLQESPERAPGWYNSYPVDIYNENNRDSAKTDLIAKNEISNRISAFAKDPFYTLKFFGKKISSTWSEPTFQSLWISYGGTGTQRDDLNHSKLENSIMTGTLHNIYVIYCDVFQNIVYIGTLYSLLRFWKKMSLYQESLLIIFLGGFAFHLFWETKSDYVLPYFFLLIPYAAAGINSMTAAYRAHPLTCERHAPKPLNEQTSVGENNNNGENGVRD